MRDAVAEGLDGGGSRGAGPECDAQHACCASTTRSGASDCATWTTSPTACLRILAGRTSAAQDLSLAARRYRARRAHDGARGAARLRPHEAARPRHRGRQRPKPCRHRRPRAWLAAVGQAKRIIERVSTGDAVIVDAESGEIHLRPSPEVVRAYSDKVRFRARRQLRYQELRDKPAVTADGVKIELNMNAGLLVDMPHLHESGADGIGLFRTELQFMLSNSLPRLDAQADMYRQILDQAGGKRVVFRALDIGGDKALPYLRHPSEDNPALGWRALRLLLDRSGLLRLQLRALLSAADGREISLMLPMVAAATEIDAARLIIRRELERFKDRGGVAPEIRLGAMIEVPSVLFELDNVLPKLDFASVGSNDLMQFFFAADRGNAHVAGRYDALSVSALRALRTIAEAAQRHGIPVTLCGEMAGRPIDAMALIGVGFRSLSMAPASLGPAKAMIRSLDAGRIAARMEELTATLTGSLRKELETYAEVSGVEN